jgi:hypothetical protein
LRVAAALPLATRVCRGKCERELPLTDEYFRPTKPSKRVPDAEPGHRGTCRRCNHERENERNKDLRAQASETKAAAPKAQWKPRVVGEGGTDGGFTEHPVDGFKWFGFPDTHGHNCDWQAISGALALSRWYKAELIILFGDHLDFEGLSRFDKPASSVFRLGEDVDAARKFLGLVRESNPNARIKYIPGNHEMRLRRYLWKHPEIAELLGWGDFPVPKILGLSEFNIEWVEDWFVRGNDKFMWKHGNAVRSKSAASAMAELERNGISGASAHTHRQGLHYKRTKGGVGVWCESGCLCDLNPGYAEGQTMDWHQGVSLGSVSLKGNGFTVLPIPIIKGRAKILGMDISE